MSEELNILDKDTTDINEINNVDVDLEEPVNVDNVENDNQVDNPADSPIANTENSNQFDADNFYEKSDKTVDEEKLDNSHNPDSSSEVIESNAIDRENPVSPSKDHHNDSIDREDSVSPSQVVDDFFDNSESSDDEDVDLNENKPNVVNADSSQENNARDSIENANEKKPETSDIPIDAASDAINKFKGELSKMTGDESSGEEDRKYRKRRGFLKGDRPVKRPKQRISNYVRETMPQPASAFVMKLFDRSVDLTQFTTDSPLYPICRAWFLNNPKTLPSRRDARKREERAASRDQYNLPEPLPAVGELTPASPLTSYPLSRGFDINYDLDHPIMSKEEILSEHTMNWAKVRNFHYTESAKRERRYKPSLSILRDLYCSRLV